MADQHGVNLPLAKEEQAPRRYAEEFSLAPAEPIQRPLTLRTVLDLFARQHVPMVVILALAMTIGVIAIVVTPPIYASVTEILVEGRTQNNPGQNPNDPINQVSLPNPETDIITQIQVLQSSKLLTDSFNLANVNFSSADIENGLAPQVRVEQVGATSVLQVRVESPSPQTAQALAQAIPQVYLGYVRTTRQAEANSALQSLEGRLKEERAEFDMALLALQEFRRKRSLLPLADEASLRSQKLATMETQAAGARGAVAAANERLRSLVAQRASLPETLRENASEANTVQLEAQRSVIADLKARRDALLVQFLPTHPDILAVDAQILAAERRLTEIPKELDRTNTSRHPEVLLLDERIASARADLKAAEAASAGISSTTGQAKGALEEYYALEPRQQELARAVEDRRLAILNMTQALDELRVRSSAARDPVTVLTPAAGASKARPNEVQYLGVSLLAGLFFAVIFAAAKDGLEERVISADELAFESRLELLGDVPISKPKKRPVLPKQLGESVQELYRQLRYRMLLATNGSLKGTILLAGAGGTFEGLGELVANLAVGFAAQQRRVIVVDADLRTRQGAIWLGTAPQPGLTDVVAGRTSLGDALQETGFEGVRHLAAGTPTSNPTDLLSADSASRMFHELAGAGDLILIVGPGYTDAADSEILASYADSIVLVARMLGTTRRAFSASLLPFHRAEATPVGLVLTRLASRKQLQA